MEYPKTSSENSIVLVKAKTNSVSNHGTVYSVFVFKNVLNVFHNIFQRNNLFRFKEKTTIISCSKSDLIHVLQQWSISEEKTDKLANSCLPYPNTKTYVWRNDYINRCLYGEHCGHVYNMSAVKQQMTEEMIDVDMFVIEMSKDLYMNTLGRNTATHLATFSVDTYFNNQNKMNNVFFSKDFKMHLRNKCICDAIGMFSKDMERLNNMISMQMPMPTQTAAPIQEYRPEKRKRTSHGNFMENQTYAAPISPSFPSSLPSTPVFSPIQLSPQTLYKRNEHQHVNNSFF